MIHQKDRTWLEVDLDAIAHNYIDVRQKITSDCRIMAVLKADAYGLGAVEIAKELESIGCNMFSVACLQEALELRENGVKGNILIFGLVNPANTELTIDNDFEVTLVSFEQAKAISEAACAVGKRIKAHLKIDVGLSRLGIVVKDRMNEALSEINKIAELKNIDLVAFYTHITNSGLPGGNEFDRAQLKLFDQITTMASDMGLKFKKHCLSSLPAVCYPEYKFDYVRLAAILLGQEPHLYGCFNTKPVIQLKSRIWQIKWVEAGTPVSYGPLFHTLRRSRIASIPIGFADGLRRSISNRGYMLVHGQKAPIIGKLCSDYSIIDLTDIPGAKEGDIVTIFGTDFGAQQYEDVYADLYPGTVSEVTSALSRRIPRFYYKGGRVIAVN